MKDAEFSAHFNEMQARIAAEDSRKLTLPASPDAYKIELPKDFKTPPGIEFKFNDGDPLLSQAKTWAQKNGLSQEAFAEGLALIAGDRVGTEESIKKTYNAEIAKLGAAGPARVDAVVRWMNAQQDGAALANILKLAPVASTISALEGIMTRMTNQGGGTFKGTGREAPEQPGKVSEADYLKMSPADRLAYARKFPQPGMARKAS